MATLKTMQYPPHPSIQALQGSGEYSDLLVVCGDGKRLNLHRAIVCPQSAYFRGLCTGRFRENASNKFESKLTEDSRLVGKVVSYLYTAEYDDSPADLSRELGNTKFVFPDGRESDIPFKAHPQCVTALTNIAVYALADKLLISGLKDLAKTKLESIEWSDWATPLNCAFMVDAACTTAADHALRDIILEKFLQKGDAVLNDSSAQRILLELRPFVPEAFFTEILLGIIRLRDASLAEAAANLDVITKSYKNRIVKLHSDKKTEIEAVEKRLKDQAYRTQRSANTRIANLELQKQGLNEKLSQHDPRFSKMKKFSDSCSYRWGGDEKDDRSIYFSLQLNRNVLFGVMAAIMLYVLIQLVCYIRRLLTSKLLEWLQCLGLYGVIALVLCLLYTTGRRWWLSGAGKNTKGRGLRDTHKRTR